MLRLDRRRGRGEDPLDAFGRSRNRQLRRLRHEGSADKGDRCADRAIIVVVGSLSGRLIRRPGRRLLRCPRGILEGSEALSVDRSEMDVAERECDLQRKRCKREISPKPPSSKQASHATMLTLQYNIWQASAAWRIRKWPRRAPSPDRSVNGAAQTPSKAVPTRATGPPQPAIPRLSHPQGGRLRGRR